MENDGWPRSVRSHGKKKRKEEKEHLQGEGTFAGGLSSLNSSYWLSPRHPEKWLKQFGFYPEMVHDMCTGLEARVSDVGLGSFHWSLSVSLPLSVLGCSLLEKAEEGRLISSELKQATGLLPWMSAISKLLKSGDSGDGEGRVKQGI